MSATSSRPVDDLAARRPFLTAAALASGAAVALGIARFSYGLLLLPMRLDLGWSYLLAGAMNTANAFGYLCGAVATPFLMRHCRARSLFTGGAALTALFMLLSGCVIDTAALLCLRVLAGIASACLFIAGGILAARLAALHGRRGGLLLYLYYGGTGAGIVLSSLLTPLASAAAVSHGVAHAWQWAWLALGTACALATAGSAWAASAVPEPVPVSGSDARFAIADFRYGLLSYFLFGIGYIGYMTFVLALLKSRGMPAPMLTGFFTALGAAVMVSAFIWNNMLNRFKGGGSLAILNALVGVATLMPAWSGSTLVVFASGLLFGAVFLSVVASTTVLVRHNLPPATWSAGISAFTVVFALGQIVGPSIVGWIADGPGGLERGLGFSAAVLFVGAVIAMRQKALATAAA